MAVYLRRFNYNSTIEHIPLSYLYRGEKNEVISQNPTYFLFQRHRLHISN